MARAHECRRSHMSPPERKAASAGGAKRLLARCTPYASASLASESARAIDSHKAPHRTLRQLFLGPTRVSEDWCTTEPRAFDKVARGFKSLRRAPSELGPDDFSRTKDARGSRTRPRGDADATECIRQGPHLLMPCGVDQLRLGHRLAPAQDSRRVSFV